MEQEQTLAEISDDGQYREAIRALDKHSRPSWVLRLIMNALERYRQSRKMGWSRPQNKKGLTVFASYTLNAELDRAIVDEAFGAARAEFGGELDAQSAHFLEELERDRGLMAFIFVHDRLAADGRYEGATFSFGRRSRGQPRFRDRFDIIVESKVGASGSTGLSSVRVFVDPFRTPIAAYPALVLAREAKVVAGEAFSSRSHQLFRRASSLHHAWFGAQERHWKHWTSEYIDYFGPRRESIPGTFFPAHADIAQRLTQAV